MLRNQKFNAFQFQYGAIKRNLFTMLDWSKPVFQFQYGAIKSLVQFVNPVYFLYFNSNMVRLKEFKAEIKNASNQLFQFQYGAIKRNLGYSTMVVRLLFQFQYGAIKSS